MKSSSVILPLVLGLFASLGQGCVNFEDDAQPVERRAQATLLTLVDESHQLTPEQLAERRQNVVSYLIAEGYIYSGEDLVQSASYADQIIRAKLALDGSFELTIFRPERLAHHEVAFDPAGYPVYTYFPGEIGYFGNGFDPYYLPIAPYSGPRYPYYRPGSHRDHDGPRPDRPRPPGQRPDWNQGNRPPTDHDNSHHDGHPGTPPPGGNRNRDRDHRPTTPPQPGQPPQDPVPPSQVTPVPPPPSAQPNPRPSGPDRQPWVRHPAQAPAAGATVPAPAASPAQPQPPRPPQGQIDHRRFRPELQPGQPPVNPSRPAPASPPPPNQSRSRPEGSPPKATPPPARTPPPPKPAPEPAKEQSTKSDTPTPSDINTNGRPRENRR